MENEVWKDIPWYNGLYQISTFGNVISLKRWNIKRLKPWNNNRWYLFVNLCKEGIHKSITIHRIMWYTFMWLEPFTDGKTSLCVCHKDDNPKNNRLDNLFLWTVKDNMNDKIRKWRDSLTRKTWIENHRSKTVLQIKNSIIIAEFYSLTHAKNITWINNSHISSCCTGKRKSAWWFIWRHK